MKARGHRALDRMHGVEVVRPARPVEHLGGAFGLKAEDGEGPRAEQFLVHGQDERLGLRPGVDGDQLARPRRDRIADQDPGVSLDSCILHKRAPRMET